MFSAQDFQQSPGNEGHWFCVICKPSPHTGLHVYDATLAMKHEKSQTHIHALKGLGSWGSSTLDSWGYDWGKDFGLHEKLKYDMEREKLPPKKRVRYWIRDMARAEGIQVEEDEDEDEGEFAGDSWDDWDSAKSGLSHKPWDECLPRSWVPASKRNVGMMRTKEMDEVDPQAAADFKFVERVAKARGIAQESKRLHYFYRVRL